MRSHPGLWWRRSMRGRRLDIAMYGSKLITERWLVSIAAIGYVAASLLGITWGLPSRASDNYLFTGSRVPSGDEVHRHLEQTVRDRPGIGADVDTSPIPANTCGLVINRSEVQRAEILRRYRLFTHQPDEMVTLMALSGINPGKLELDPRLYQYGGLFVYPVGGLIGVSG